MESVTPAPSTTLLELEPGQAHVWYCWTDQCLDQGWEEFYRSLLTADEAERMQRFKFEYLQREYLVTRALCRITLSRYAAVHPAAWHFHANAYGRPEIAAPANAPALRFNMSNARSLIACVVTRTADAGVDVEETDRPGETVGIADRFFSPREVDSLRAQHPERQRQRFFEFWTLKESYIKARGMGLSIPLEQFSFELGDAIRIGFDAALEDRAEDWYFELHRPSARHLLAVGLRCGGRPSSIVVRETVPAPDSLPAVLP